VGKLFYMPGRTGYEGKIREEVLRRRELQAAMVLGSPLSGDAELLSWSASSKGREHWFKRLESGRSGLLLVDRDRILGAVKIKRQDRILIVRGDDGLLLWESLRRVPEGLCACLVGNEEARDTLLRYAATLDEEEQPRLAVEGPELPTPEEAECLFSCPVYDHIFSREPWRRMRRGDRMEDIFGVFARGAFRLLARGGDLTALQSPPRLGERISRFITDGELAEKLRKAEEAFFAGGDFWESAALEGAFREAGFETTVETVDQKEERLIGAADLDLWFDSGHSRWGGFIRDRLGAGDFGLLERALRELVRQGPLSWTWKSLLLRARKN
jgi:putative ATPase